MTSFKYFESCIYLNINIGNYKNYLPYYNFQYLQL